MYTVETILELYQEATAMKDAKTDKKYATIIRMGGLGLTGDIVDNRSLSIKFNKDHNGISAVITAKYESRVSKDRHSSASDRKLFDKSFDDNTKIDLSRTATAYRYPERTKPFIIVVGAHRIKPKPSSQSSTTLHINKLGTPTVVNTSEFEMYSGSYADEVKDLINAVKATGGLIIYSNIPSLYDEITSR